MSAKPAADECMFNHTHDPGTRCGKQATHKVFILQAGGAMVPFHVCQAHAQVLMKFPGQEGCGVCGGDRKGGDDMSDVKPIDILVKAKEYLEQGWCQGDLAQDELGRAVDPLEPSACQWCAGGAIEVAAWDLGGKPETLDVDLQFARGDASEALEMAIGDGDIADWNDNIGQPVVHFGVL